MKNSLGRDFTVLGILKFTAAPTIMTIFMALYTMIDGVFVSNFVSEYALSAINIVFPIQSIIIALACMIGTGGSAIIAKNMGEGKTVEANQNFALICLFGCLVGLTIVTIGFIFIDQIIIALGATKVLFDYCKDYLLIIAIGSPLGIFQMMFQFFFVTAGKPKIGLITTVCGGIMNIVLDYVFIVHCGMGISGAAVATVIGYSVPALYGVYYFGIRRKTVLHFQKPKWRPAVLRSTCSNGSSEMVSNLAVAVTTFLFNMMMLMYLGENGVAAVTIILYAQYLLTSIFMGFSQGMAPIFSYNYGEGNRAKIRKYFKMSMVIITIASLLMVAISNVFGEVIVSIFSKEGTEVFDIAIHGFTIFSFGFLFAGFNIYSSALFTAFSNGKISALISLLRTFVYLIASLILLPQVFGYVGVWYAVPVAEFLSILTSGYCLIRSREEYGYM